MNTNRKISPTTLMLVEAMAHDMSMPKGYRAFQQKQLERLRAVVAEQERPPRTENPADRFAKFLQPCPR